MTSSIVKNHMPVHERQYHETDSAYVLPNDATEHNRLDAQAAAIAEMIGGLPFQTSFQEHKTISKAIDVGCGTGVATLQLASLFPQAKIYGLDISAVPEASKSIAPANVTWALGNILNVSPDDRLLAQEIFVPGSIDYLFGRMLFLGVNDWPKYFHVAAEALRPGGLLEHQDLDWRFYRAQSGECLSDGWEWHKQVLQANDKSGLSNHAGSGAEGHLRKAGFEIVSRRQYEFSFVPTAKTPDSRHMGRYVQEKLMPHYPELLRKILGEQGVDAETLERLTKDCLRDLSSEEGVHQRYTVTVARKL